MKQPPEEDMDSLLHPKSYEELGGREVFQAEWEALSRHGAFRFVLRGFFNSPGWKVARSAAAGFRYHVSAWFRLKARFGTGADLGQPPFADHARSS